MDPSQYEALKQSIAERGIREEVVLLDGKLLDGRHRYQAAKELGLPVPAREYDPATDGESPAEFVLDKNVNRRSLTPSQRAVIAVEVLPHFEAEAAARKAKTAFGAKSVVGAPVRGPSVGSGKASEKAARVTGATPRMVEIAKTVVAESPVLASKVKSGEITVKAAQREIRKAKAPPAPPPPEVPPTATKASHAVAQSETFNELVNRTHALRRDIELLAKTETGAELRIKQISAHLNSVTAAIRFAIPSHACPYMPACTVGQCKTCAGRQWVTQEIWDRLPPEVKS